MYQMNDVIEQFEGELELEFLLWRQSNESQATERLSPAIRFIMLWRLYICLTSSNIQMKAGDKHIFFGTVYSAK